MKKTDALLKKSIVKTLIIIIILTTLASSHLSAQLQFTQITPTPSGDILFNPGMGLYIAGGSNFGYQPQPDAWLLSVCDIIYFRPTWNDLESDGPLENFDAYFKPIFDFWVVKMHKRAAFRVMSESMHYSGKYATPKWVFDKGVPNVTHRGLRSQEQIDPVFWNPQYLKLHCQFLQRLGKYLDGKQGLEYIDIGGIGEWGEMHLGLHIPGRWTPAQLEQTGFTREKYIAAYRRVIDQHAESFPNTRVFLNVGSYAQINDYAALRGLHFRQDGLTPNGPSHNVGKVYYRPYSQKGVICNYEFHSSYNSMLEKNWDLAETLQNGLGDPISYLNTNVFSASQWEKAPSHVKKLFTDAAKKIGFRFTMTSLYVPTRINLSDNIPSRLLVKHSWKNTGIAPCYESYALLFTIHDSNGNIIASQQHFPNTPTTLWSPDKQIDDSILIRLPKGLPAGPYELKIAMYLPEKPGPNIQLDLAGRDDTNRYSLCKIPGVKADGPTGIVYEQNFESSKHGWKTNPSIVSRLDSEISQQGSASLHLSGRQTGGWNYIYHSLKTPILPAARYRLTGWIKVDSLEPNRLAPYLKIGLNDSGGKWIDNRHTNKYDMKKQGTWQKLEAVFETPPETATGSLALERGTNTTSTQINLWLDSVQLELLEAP